MNGCCFLNGHSSYIRMSFMHFIDVGVWVVQTLWSIKITEYSASTLDWQVDWKICFKAKLKIAFSFNIKRRRLDSPINGFNHYKIFEILTFKYRRSSFFNQSQNHSFRVRTFNLLWMYFFFYVWFINRLICKIKSNRVNA